MGGRFIPRHGPRKISGIEPWDSLLITPSSRPVQWEVRMNEPAPAQVFRTAPASPRDARKEWAAPLRLVLATFVITVGAFVSTTLATGSRLLHVSADSEQIYSNAIPRIAALATLRARVRDLVTQLDRGVAVRGTEPFDFDAQVLEVRGEAHAVEQHAASGQVRDRWIGARMKVDAVLAAAQRVRALLATGRVEDAQARLESEVRPAAASADSQLWTLVELDATEVARSARDIDQLRKHASLLAYGLDGLCVAIASVLAAIALRAVRESARLNQARSLELEQFAARVAHDLAGPLSPVLFALQEVQRHVADEGSLRKTVDRGVRGVARVTSLIDDLLGFARAGGAPTRSAKTCILPVMHATVEDARAFADSYAVHVCVDPQATDATVACGSGVLSSIVSNLVRNSIKFMGHATERHVFLRVTPVGARVRVEVKDTGPGLPAGAERSVFEAYVRADPTGQPGLGLGLATVKRLVDAHGGAVGVKSTTRGCTFWFELPLAEKDDRPGQAAVSVEEAGAPRADLPTTGTDAMKSPHRASIES
jgi:signal transduction histidine kinase